VIVLNRRKFSITLEEETINFLDDKAKIANMNRSRFIEFILTSYSNMTPKLDVMLENVIVALKQAKSEAESKKLEK